MQTKEFNPNGIIPDNGNYFGMPLTPDEAALVLISAPWDVTVSQRAGSGSSYAPDAIIEASRCVGFYDPSAPNSWRKGIATAPIDYTIQDRSHRLRSDAEKVVKLRDELDIPTLENIMHDRRVRRVNEGLAEFNAKIYTQTQSWLEKGKIVGLVGGDHSVAYGALRAMGEKYGRLGVLAIDSSCDLMASPHGFDFSNMSVMHDVLRDVSSVESLVYVGVREFAPEEWRRAETDRRITMFPAQHIYNSIFEGRSWGSIVDDIVAALPDNIYISLDINALTAECAPHTGVRVPGGLRFPDVVYLMERIVASGRRIVGFDLSEVVPDVSDKTDASIAARLLFKMCGIALKNHHAVEVI